MVVNVSNICSKTIVSFWFKYDLEQKCHAPQVRPDRGSNSWPPDHDSTFHVTETPALTTRPSVTYHDYHQSSTTREIFCNDYLSLTSITRKIIDDCLKADCLQHRPSFCSNSQSNLPTTDKSTAGEMTLSVMGLLAHYGTNGRNTDLFLMNCSVKLSGMLLPTTINKIHVYI